LPTRPRWKSRRCRLAGPRLTDLPSVRRTDPTCD
jgi:hypothetical protein